MLVTSNEATWAVLHVSLLFSRWLDPAIAVLKRPKALPREMAFSQSSSVFFLPHTEIFRSRAHCQAQALQIRKLMAWLEEQNKGRQIGWEEVLW
jgi:hypothetical protein